MLSPEPELPDQLTGLWEDWRAVRMKSRQRKLNFLVTAGWPFFCAAAREVKLSALRAIPTTGRT